MFAVERRCDRQEPLDIAEPIITEWSMTMRVSGIRLKHSGPLGSAHERAPAAEAQLRPARG